MFGDLVLKGATMLEGVIGLADVSVDDWRCGAVMDAQSPSIVSWNDAASFTLRSRWSSLTFCRSSRAFGLLQHAATDGTTRSSSCRTGQIRCILRTMARKDARDWNRAYGIMS